MCNKLDIRFGRCKDDVKAMLAKQGITKLTTAQLKNAMDKVEEELYAIIFMYKTDKSRHGRIIEETKMMYWKAKTHSQRRLLRHAGY